VITPEAKAVLVELTLSLLLFSTFLYNPMMLLALTFLTSFFSLYVVVASRRLASVTPESIRATRGLRSVEVLRGSGFEVRLSLELEWYGTVEVRDLVPSGIRVVSGSTSIRVRVSGRTALSLSYEAAVWSGYRAVEFEGAKVVLYDPLGLVGRSLFVPAPMEVLVPFERTRHAGFWTTSMVRLTPGSGTVLNTAIGDEHSFVGVRPFAEGDKVRDVHWRRTAALTDEDALLVKRYDRLGRGNVVAVVDCAPEMSFGTDDDYLDTVLGVVWMTGKSAIDQGSSFRLVLVRSEGPRVFWCRSVAELSVALSGVDVDDRPVTSLEARELEGVLMSGSYVIVYTSVCSRNSRALTGLISSAVKRGCRVTVVLPDLGEFGAALDRLVLDALKACEGVYLSGLPVGCEVRRLGRSPSLYVIRRALLHEGW